jgi:hypothetical protein
MCKVLSSIPSTTINKEGKVKTQVNKKNKVFEDILRID